MGVFAFLKTLVTKLAGFSSITGHTQEAIIPISGKWAVLTKISRFVSKTKFLLPASRKWTLSIMRSNIALKANAIIVSPIGRAIRLFTKSGLFSKLGPMVGKLPSVCYSFSSHMVPFHAKLALSSMSMVSIIPKLKKSIAARKLKKMNVLTLPRVTSLDDDDSFKEVDVDASNPSDVLVFEPSLNIVEMSKKEDFKFENSSNILFMLAIFIVFIGIFYISLVIVKNKGIVSFNHVSNMTFEKLQGAIEMLKNQIHSIQNQLIKAKNELSIMIEKENEFKQKIYYLEEKLKQSHVQICYLEKEKLINKNHSKNNKKQKINHSYTESLENKELISLSNETSKHKSDDEYYHNDKKQQDRLSPCCVTSPEIHRSNQTYQNGILCKNDILNLTNKLHSSSSSQQNHKNQNDDNDHDNDDELYKKKETKVLNNLKQNEVDIGLKQRLLDLELELQKEVQAAQIQANETNEFRLMLAATEAFQKEMSNIRSGLNSTVSTAPCTPQDDLQINNQQQQFHQQQHENCLVILNKDEMIDNIDKQIVILQQQESESENSSLTNHQSETSFMQDLQQEANTLPEILKQDTEEEEEEKDDRKKNNILKLTDSIINSPFELKSLTSHPSLLQNSNDNNMVINQKNEKDDHSSFDPLEGSMFRERVYLSPTLRKTNSENKIQNNEIQKNEYISVLLKKKSILKNKKLIQKKSSMTKLMESEDHIEEEAENNGDTTLITRNENNIKDQDEINNTDQGSSSLLASAMKTWKSEKWRPGWDKPSNELETKLSQRHNHPSSSFVKTTKKNLYKENNSTMTTIATASMLCKEEGDRDMVSRNSSRALGASKLLKMNSVSSRPNNNSPKSDMKVRNQDNSSPQTPVPTMPGKKALKRHVSTNIKQRMSTFSR